MTAVANPPSLSNLNRPQWGVNGGQSLNSINSDDPRGMFATRKTIQRTNSSSSISSNSSTSSSSTLVSSNGSTNGAQVSAAGDLSGWPNANTRKRPPPKGSQWPTQKPDTQPDFARMPAGRPQMMGGINGVNSVHQPSSFLPPQGQMSAQGGMARPMADPLAAGQPVLYLLSLNGTFERKTISVPFLPETLRIGRQTNAKTVPTPVNGFFDSKVLSRQHAEIWADRQGKIWIRDIKSSNGTFVNGTRLSAENRESEPHELQTSDHLELGIDIVSEDQKSVVHHKVAAKVEHAGFLNPSSNLLDMSFGDLDPTNPMMQQMGGQFRGRTSSQASMGPGGRLGLGGNMNGQVNGMAMQRGGLFLTQPSTEAIVKKLHQEMRNARLQAEDLSRTNRFIHALLSKEDIKNEQKPEVPEPPKSHLVNGNALPFRPDPKARFSEPPAPPPQQPLPEKPDVPSLKRGTTERPKAPPQTASPVRPDNTSQILQLTEALDSARKEIDNHHARMKELEKKYQEERQRRESAEEQVKLLEDAASTKEANGAAVSPDTTPALEEKIAVAAAESTSAADDDATHTAATETPSEPTEAMQARIDAMVAEVKGLKDLVEEFRKRAEKAEAERDEDRKTLSEMVAEIRRRDEEEARRKAKERTRSSSVGRKGVVISSPANPDVSAVDGASESGPAEKESPADPAEEYPTLSRANTITPTPQTQALQASDPVFIHGMPYASMLGVVIFGMGLMAYLNGWQPQGRLDQ
ncbi:uncharacterized protein E0L32_007976 [Thyridium curvatum]|uniref:FHA domain-containing protein n=1 Tax=Thyridium curvatum TaxID=1093900 RepID=A0A507AKQ7_9PEZI|nr:uncharacterized protein E0L32_007976 [Thyridium curvatum]TPX11115.1 hypothetical protein E0L32_007976 [Thyridium curvatum]